MKFLSRIFVLLCASAASVSAFSLDFSTLNLDENSPFTFSASDELVMTVEDFGNIVFSTSGGQVGEVIDFDGAGTQGIDLASADPITVSFISGSPVQNVILTFVDSSLVESTSAAPVGIGVDPTFQIPTNSSTAGLVRIDFDRVGPKVPEPSSALLGLIGLGALLRRRR